MKAVLFVALCCAAYYTQAQTYFSESKVQQWLVEHNTKALAGNLQACNDFTDSMQAAFESEQGVMWQLNGSKSAMCRHLLQSAKVLSPHQPSTEIEQLRIEPLGFPWLGAKVSYIERLRTQGKNLPTLESVSHNEVVISRTASGFKIHSFTAKAAS